MSSVAALAMTSEFYHLSNFRTRISIRILCGDVSVSVTKANIRSMLETLPSELDTRR